MVKNISKFVLLLILIYIWLPLGVEDVIITPTIIGLVGFEMYVLISIILIIYLYKTIEGKTLGDKLREVQREVKSIF